MWWWAWSAEWRAGLGPVFHPFGTGRAHLGSFKGTIFLSRWVPTEISYAPILSCSAAQRPLRFDAAALYEMPVALVTPTHMLETALSEAFGMPRAQLFHPMHRTSHEKYDIDLNTMQASIHTSSGSRVGY